MNSTNSGGEVVYLPSPPPIEPRITQDAAGRFWLEGVEIQEGMALEVVTEPDTEALTDKDEISMAVAMEELGLLSDPSQDEIVWMSGKVHRRPNGTLIFRAHHYPYGGALHAGWRAVFVGSEGPVRDTEAIRIRGARRTQASLDAFFGRRR